MTMVLTVHKRQRGRQSSLTQLRQNGAIPGVIYGFQMTSTAISLDARTFAKMLAAYGSNGVFQLELEGKPVNAVLTEVQRCALKGNVKHVDFKSINMAEELEVDVPVVPIGDAAGVAAGGLLLQPNREVRIKVKPTEIPETIDIDVTNIAIGTSLYVGDIRHQLPFEILQEDDYTLVTITPPPAENVQEDDTMDDTPEVIEATGQNTGEPEA
ncbi:50S ribosomal protein L25/general stress protein Ctc [Lysinibacillus sp. FSL K6-0232]|uniref:50S ribosomal protein L25/general stress protein Ctc n=1 Tax=unclassified Lysinibacillus TaxID=2636778 RepID=UPI0030F8FA18